MWVLIIFEKNKLDTLTKAVNVALRRLEREFECCGVGGPGDYIKMGAAMKLLSGEQAAPAWLRAYGFGIFVEQPTMAPPLIPPRSPPPGSDEDNDVIGSGLAFC